VVPSFLWRWRSRTLAAAIAGFFAVRSPGTTSPSSRWCLAHIYLVAVRRKSFTGGDDGLSFRAAADRKFGNLELTLLDPTFQYFFILAVVSACYLLQWSCCAPAGVAFTAVRENATRAGLAANPYLIRLTSFVMAGFLAGLPARCLPLSRLRFGANTCTGPCRGGGDLDHRRRPGTLFGPAIGAALLVLVRESCGTGEHYLILVAFRPDVVTSLPRDRRLAASQGGREAVSESILRCAG